MRFTEAKRGKSWILIIALLLIVGVLALGFCQFAPTQTTVQKTIVFEAD